MQQLLSDVEAPVIISSLWPYSLSFIGAIEKVEVHYHNSYKVVISLDNSFDSVIEGQSFSNLRGFIVNQNIRHSCDAPGVRVLANLIEPDSFWGRQLRSLLDGKPFLNINAVLNPEQLSQVFPTNYADLPNDELMPYVRSFFDKLFPVALPQDTLAAGNDDHIQAALHYIDQHIQERLDLEDIADFICLSPDRTRHIFVSQMGIPLSQYIIWKRIKGVLITVMTRQSRLTEASIQFGFTDQPHFNRAFKRIFGFKPTILIRYCRILL